MGVQPLPQSKPLGQSATEQLLQLPEKTQNGREQQLDNFG